MDTLAVHFWGMFRARENTPLLGFTFLITGHESKFTTKESMVISSKNSTKRSIVVNDIDGDGDGDDDDDENGEGIKCYLKKGSVF